MKLTELIERAAIALRTFGDLDVCTPAAGDTFNEGVVDIDEVLTRTRGDRNIPMSKWVDEDHESVFVLK